MFKKSILFKILGVVVSITVVGFAVLIYKVLEHERDNLIREREKASRLMAEPILFAIYEDMMNEKADVVRYLIKSIRTIKGAERVQIIRNNGVEEAFQDFKTIQAVEKVYGRLKPEWVADHLDKEINIADGIDNPRFGEAIKLFNEGRKKEVSYIEEYNGKRFYTYLVPIEAKTECRSCHALKEEARGVLMISTSMDEADSVFASGRVRWIAYGFLTITGVSIVLIFVVRSIIRPLQEMSSTAKDIAGGNFSISIPVSSGDEVGILSESFNKMARELEARIAELKKLSTAIEHSLNLVFITDPEGNIEYVNPSFEQVAGWSKEEAVGENPRIVASGDTPKVVYKELWGAITSGKTWQGILKNKNKNGEFYWCNTFISPIVNEKGEVVHFLAIQEDITEKKKSEEKAQYLTTHDELTGLINRARFMEFLGEWVSSDADHKMTGVILLIDIDEFKFINDTYGHLFGDQVLQRTAGFLKGIFRDIGAPDIKKAERESVIARLGADEFAIFIPHADASGGSELAEHIRKRFEGIYSMLGEFVPSSVSIGVAAYPEHGTTIKELITKVDIAMNHAKERGRNRCHVYRPEDLELEKIHSRLKKKEIIQKAIEEDRFEPWFQPILDLQDNKVRHYEALARLKGEGGEILFPGMFIETAERFGQVNSIDKIIIEKTMRRQAEAKQEDIAVFMSINLSGKELGDESLLSFLKSKIEETGVNPDHLVFEITETAAISDLDRAVRFIKALKEIGCHFSLDDFGVGFTSFIYLREMKVDYIKIAGSFIRKLNENVNDQLFVKAITSVAKGMGIKTVAEFVENEEIIKYLKKYGVDYAQGYAIGKPLPWAEIRKKIYEA